MINLHELKISIYLSLFHCTLDCANCGFGSIEYDYKKKVYRERCHKIAKKPVWGSVKKDYKSPTIKEIEESEKNDI